MADEGGAGDAKSGGCLCGAVRFQMTGPLRPVVNCHCRQCQRSHGNFIGYTAVKREDLQFREEGGLKWYRSAENARRGFCDRCGSSLFWDRLNGPYVSVAAGCIDPPSGLKTLRHIFVASKGDYYEITDDLECLDAGQSNQWSG